MNKGRLNYLYQLNLDPGEIIPNINGYCLIGFIEGDGTFYLESYNYPRFSIGQNAFSVASILSIKNFFSLLSYGSTNYNFTVETKNIKSKGTFTYKKNLTLFPYSIHTLICFFLLFFTLLFRIILFSNYKISRF